MSEMNKSLLDTISNDLRDVSFDALELYVDSELTDGLLKDLPIVRYIYKACNMVLSIRDFFFVKKLTRFINNIGSIEVESRIKFLEKIDKDKDSFSEELLMLIDRLDSIDKADIVANIFRSYVNEKISKEQFLRMCNVTDKLFIGDIQYLNNLDKDEGLHGIEVASLTSNNLTVRYTFDGGTWGKVDTRPEYDQNMYRITKLGKDYKKYALSKVVNTGASSIT